MKRKSTVMAAVLCLLSLASSCRKGEEAPVSCENSGSVNENTLVITGRMGGGDTKVTYTIGTSKISQGWSVGDTILGIDGSGFTYTYVASKVNSDGTASFSLVKGGSGSRYGTATSDPGNDTVMHMIYAPGYAAKDFSGGNLNINISSQDTTNVGGSAAGTNIPGIMTAHGTVSGGKLDLTFSNQLELLEIKDPTFSGVTSATTITSFSVSGTSLPTTATFSSSGFTVGSDNGKVTKKCSLTTTSTGTTTGTVLIALLPTTAQDLIIKSSNSYVDTVKSHAPAASGLCLVSGATFAPIPLDPSIGTPVTIDGVTWAQYNCGYDSSHEYGLLYQWAKKQGFDYEGSITTSSDQLNSMAAGIGCTKFITGSNCWYKDSTIDDKWLTDKNYDPCPEGWRVPTEGELSGLGSSTWVTDRKMDGTSGGTYSGRLFGTSPNQLFLPAAGYRLYGSGNASNRGSYGRYWSSSPDSGNASYAQYLNFYDGNARMYSSSRASGYSVRCVQDK